VCCERTLLERVVEGDLGHEESLERQTTERKSVCACVCVCVYLCVCEVGILFVYMCMCVCVCVWA
jgi:hypothetical protein